MDQEVWIGLEVGNSAEEGPGSRIDPRRWRHAHPEREHWVVTAAYEDNTFDLSRPEGWAMSAVPGIVPGLYRSIRVGSGVTVAWIRAGEGARQRPYVRGRSSSRLGLICEISGEDIFPGARPGGMRMDPGWQTDVIGSSYPHGNLCIGRREGKPCGWIISGNKRITHFDLQTGETFWVSDSLGQTSHLGHLQLLAERGELVLTTQEPTGTGQHTIKRISACSGELLATSRVPQGDGLAGLWHLLGPEHLAGVVPSAGVNPANMAYRLQVYSRLPVQRDRGGEAYAAAYTIPLLTGGGPVGTALSGGGTVAGYYAPTQQALLVVNEKETGTTAVVRARVMCWDVPSGRVRWTWSPHRSLGLRADLGAVTDQKVLRDPDGSIYYWGRYERGLDRKSYMAKLSHDGGMIWRIELDAAGTLGQYFDPFVASGILGNCVLTGLTYNDNTPPQDKLILVTRGGGQIGEGPVGWRGFSGDSQGLLQGDDWTYCFSEIIDETVDKLRYHIADNRLTSLVSWQQVLGEPQADRTTPDAGPAALFDGWIYGVNHAGDGWRVRRWQ